MRVPVRRVHETASTNQHLTNDNPTHPSIQAACYQRLSLFGPTSLASTAFSLSRLGLASPAPVPFLDALR